MLNHYRNSRLMAFGTRERVREQNIQKIKKASSSRGLSPPSRLSITDNSGVPNFVPTLVQNQ
jgi:hypothetical protein